MLAHDPVFRFRSQSLLGRAVLLAGTSSLALTLVAAAPARARPLGVPGSATANVAAIAQAAAQQAAGIAKQSQASLLRAAQAIQAMQAAQRAAHDLAAAGSNNLGADPNHPGSQLPNVPDGLTAGGLVPDNGLASAGVANAVTTWVNASAPTQTIGNGRTNVVINQVAPRALMNWTTFNVGKNTTVSFNQQGNTDWIALNRITDPTGVPSQILGHISASGSVYVINQNGIIFGGSSQVNVGSLIVSSLWMNQQLFNNGQLNNPNGEFLFVGSGMPFANPTMQPADPNTDVAPVNGFNGDVTVQAGASIVATPLSVNSGGRVTLVGPNVTNGGTIIASAGQVILAAGLQAGFIAHASNDPSLRGLDSFVGSVGTAGTATNSGLISVPRGDVTMVGARIVQDGAIDSSTSVAFNGRVDLSANYMAQFDAQVVSPTFFPSASGQVELGAGSVIRILPETESPDTIAASVLTLRSLVKIAGHDVALGDGAMITAPNAGVTLQAGDFTVLPGGPASFVNTSGQITLAPGASIDVSGSQDVLASVADNFVQAQLLGPQFANSPLQRNGPLRAKTITVDIRVTGTNPDGTSWIGTPLADVSGYVGLIQRNVGQLTVDGGGVSLSAGSSVILQSGSSINVSGGWLDYQGAFVGTTRLVGADGRIYDVSKASPDIVYAGVCCTFTVDHAHWGIKESFGSPLTGSHFEPGYIQGGNGGTLSIQAPVQQLDGSQLVGQTVNGTRQQATPTKPGALSLGFFGNDPNSPENLIGGAPLISFGTGSSNPSANRVVLAPDLLGSSGFGSLSIDNGDGDITIDAGVRLAGAVGGNLTLSGKDVTIGGSIVMPSGQISITTHDFSPYGIGSNAVANTAVDPSRGNFTLGSDATLDASGPTTYSLTALNGGSVSIKSVTASLHAGSTIDVSGGIAAVASRKISVGNGGAISLLAGIDDPIFGGNLVLGNGLGGTDVNLRGYGARTGGSLTLRSTLVQIGGRTTDANVLVLAPDLFDRGGFSNFSVQAIGEQTAAGYAAALRIAAGTAINPVATNIVASLGSRGSVVLTPVVYPVDQRMPVNLTFAALGKRDGSGAILVRGDFVMEEGAAISTDPGGHISIDDATTPEETSNKTTILGSISAPGGSITVSGSAEIDFSGLISVALGDHAVLSAAGVAIPSSNPRAPQTGSVLAGGTVALSGNIDVSAGALIDVSGTSGPVMPSGSASLTGRTSTQTADSDAGMIVLKADQSLFIGSPTLSAFAGGASAAGGTLIVATSKANLKVSQTSSPNRDGSAALGVDVFAAGGFDSLGLGGATFSGPVAISARRSITVGAISADDRVLLRAPYVAVGGLFSVGPPVLTQNNSSFGPGSLDVSAKLIDIGNLTLTNIGKAAFTADDGDIRGAGVLDVSGVVTMRAGQIYPASATQFIIAAHDYTDGFGAMQPGTVMFSPSAGSVGRPLPLSAGGELDVYASVIDQGGVLRAPFGVINLGLDPVSASAGERFNVAQSVILRPGSVTSVSGVDPATGKPIIVPYGIDNGISWIDPVGNDITAGGLPAKSVNIFGATIRTEAGSTVDLRGGGDLYAYHFVPGLGGSRDILNSSTTAFAILPGYAFDYAPYGAFNPGAQLANGAANPLAGDPGYVSGNLTVGDKVYLSGGNGFAAGVYTLLPPRYALLPGAFLVTPQKGAAGPAAAARPDGSIMMAGYRFNDPAGTGAPARQLSEFEVASAAVMRQRAQYDDFFANATLAQGALANDRVVPRLPQDAGHLLFDGANAITIKGFVLSQTPDGLGGEVDIASANDIVITGSGSNTGGYSSSDVFLSAQDLTALGLDSLLIGGIRAGGAGGTNVAVTTNNITLDNSGTKLAAADLTLVANNTLTLAGGADLEQQGTLSHSADVLVFGNASAPGSGNGALVRVSSDQTARIVRAGVAATSSPKLSIGAGAVLSSASVIIDSTATASLDRTAILRTSALTIGSGRISLQLDPSVTPGANPGLILSAATLNALQASLQSLSLLSYSSIDIYGGGTVGSPLAQSLTFHTGEIRGFGSGGTASFAAQTILIDNVNGSVGPGSIGASSNTLVLSASTLHVGSGILAIDQYAGVVLSASNGVLVEGTGGLSVQHDLIVTTPLLTGTTAANQTMSAGGRLAFDTPGAGASSLRGGLGAKFAATGAQVVVDGSIVLHSGALSLRATSGDVIVGGSNADATLDVTGVAQAFNDVTKYTSAGSISLTSDNGSVDLTAGALYLDAQRVQSGATPALGAAGALSISAVNGKFAFGSALVLSAVGGSVGTNGAGIGKNGTFMLDVGSLATTAPLDALLNKASFVEARSYRVRSGDVTLGGTARAHSFALSADQGAISVSGTIDASGATGGSIFLAAGKDVTLTAGAVLDVRAAAFDDAGKGGSVDIETRGNGSKGIDIETGSTIALSVAGGAGGTLHLRAPRTGVSTANPGGTDVLIAPINGTVAGASSIVVEGYKVYDTGPSGSIDGLLASNGVIRNEANSFLGASSADTHYGAIVNRLFANSSALKSISSIEPGAEVVNSNLSYSAVQLTLTNSGSSGVDVTPNTAVTLSAGSVSLSYLGSTNGQTVTFSGSGTASVTWTDDGAGPVLGIITASDGSVTQIISGTPAVISPGSTVTLFSQSNQSAQSPVFTVTSGAVTMTTSTGGTFTASTANAALALPAQSTFSPLGSVAINPSGAGTLVWLGAATGNTISVPAGVSIVLPNGTPNGVSAAGANLNDVIKASVAGTFTRPDGTTGTIAANVGFSVPPGTTISLRSNGTISYVSGAGGAIEFALAPGHSYTLSGGTNPLVSFPGTNTQVFTPSGALTLGTLTSSTQSDVDLSGWRFGPNAVPGVLTLRAPGDIALYNSIGDGFSNPGNLTAATLAQWGQELFTLTSDRSWSYRIVAGADLTAADDRQVQPLSSLGNSGSVLLGKYSNAPTAFQEPDPGSIPKVTTRAPYFGLNNNTTTCSTAVVNCYNYYQVIRSGTGDIDIVAGRDVQLRNPFAVIYTAGQSAAPLTGFDIPNLTYAYIAPNDPNSVKTYTPQIYPAQYSLNGGNVTVSAGNDIAQVTLAFDRSTTVGLPYQIWQQGSSGELPDNWLYRRGYIDPVSGNFGMLLNGDARVNQVASTTWWVDFSNFSEGIGALGGGNLKLIAGRDVSNVDAVVPTNARMPGKDQNNVPIAPNAASLVELGGGDLLVQAGRDINGGVYYVERGQGVLRAGGSIHSNFTRATTPGSQFVAVDPNDTNSSNWLGTTLFLGKGAFDVSAVGDLLLGPVANPFVLPQGWGNSYWYKTYFTTYAPTDTVDVTSLTGSVTIRDSSATSSGNPSGDLDAWINRLLVATGGAGGNPTTTSSFEMQPWLATVETDRSPFQTAASLMPATLRVTAFSGDINTAGSLTLAPAPKGTLDLLAAGAINGFANLNGTGTVTTINLSDADPSRLPGITDPYGLFPLAVTVINGVPTYTPSSLNARKMVITNNGANSNGIIEGLALPFDPLFQETGATSLTLAQKQALHAQTPVHSNDDVPLHLYAGGDISGVELFSAKAAQIVAGHDMTDIAYYIQDLNADDLTKVVAGRDIIAFDPFSPLRLRLSNVPILGAPNAGDIQLAGPGSLEVLAGRNLGLGIDSSANILNDGTRLGITTIGNFANPFLPGVGADVFVGAGLGKLSGLDASSINLVGFTTQFLDPDTAGDLANRYLPELGKLINLSGAGNVAIWNAYRNLPGDKQARLGLDIFYLVLRDAGRDHNDPSSPNFNQFTNGYEAIADLFPGNARSGDITLTSREIKTKSGGDISIFAPGGAVDVGVDLGQNQPIDQGILTERRGNINIFARNSVNVGTSRIFTLDGGNEVIWSTTGNIAAGAASKTLRDAVPQRVLIDPDTTNVETDLAGFATGGGIGVLQALPGAPIGNVDLIAPVGTVDAGDAGIRSSGNVNIVAVLVLNAFNIQAGGTVTGVPVVQAPNIGALTSASNTAGAASKSADVPNGSAGNNDRPSIIIVEFLGFGGGDDGSGSQPSPNDKQDRNRSDNQGPDPRSRYQVVGVGPLTEDQARQLADEKRRQVGR